MTTRDQIIDWYGTYIEACNQRDWPTVASRVSSSVLVNGVPRSRAQYVQDIQDTVASFPDYRWELRRAVVEGEWLAVHLHDRGTRAGSFRGAPGDRAVVETDEFNMYRIANGAIAELEGTADNARLVA